MNGQAGHLIHRGTDESGLQYRFATSQVANGLGSP